MSLYDWSTTAATNSNADSNISWAEGQNSNTVNNSARAEMAAVAAFLEQINGSATTGGAGNAYTLTSASGNALTAYAAGNIVTFKANHTNTGAATLNVDGLGAKGLKKFGTTDVVANDIEINNLILAIYDGTNFQIMSPVANNNVEAFSALTSATDTMPYFDGASSMATTALTAFARTMLDDANATAVLATLGTGTAALVNTGTGTGDVPTTSQADARYCLESNNLSDLNSASTALSNLGIANARNITFGTAAPGALATGAIYLRHD